ncbi:SMC family ATPase [Roseburia hominis]
MRPISIRFQCFGPYLKEQFIEFETFAKNGLFLICGETGAGKTTILDAMCYALYGKSSGGQKGDRGDLSVMRCALAKKEDETLVEFIFEAGGRRYKFVRSLKYSRKNLHDYHNCMVFEAGEYVPIFENPKKQNVNQKAEELLGLTDKQFRQVVVLPQGQFERFLVSDSAEKETILVSLFKADRWQKIADEIFRRVTEEDQELQRESARMADRLADYACGSVKEFEEFTQCKKAALEQVKLQAEQAGAVEKKAKEVCVWAGRLHEEFVHLQELREKARALHLREEGMKEEEAFLVLADRAEEVRPLYLAYEEVKRKEQESLRELAAAEENLALVRAKRERAGEEKARHEAGRSGYEERQRRNTLLMHARELYAALEEKKAAVIRAEKEWKKKEGESEAAKEVFAKVDEAWISAMEVQRARIREYTDAQSAYLQGISGILAEQLREGEPCPVCGSREHPQPASVAMHTTKTSDGRFLVSASKVTEKDLERLGSAMEEANQKVERAAKERREAEGIYQSVSGEAAEARQRALAFQTAYGEMEKQKISGIDTSEQLERALNELGSALAEYVAEEQKLQAQLTVAMGNEQAARIRRSEAAGKAERAGKVLEEKQETWTRIYREKGFASEQDFSEKLLKVSEKNARWEAVIQFRTDLRNAMLALDEQEKKLDGEDDPDIEFIRKNVEESEAKRGEAERNLILGQQELKRLEKEVRALKASKKRYDMRRIKVDENLEFASRLRGRSGISLQRYVLGVMLSSVTVEANRLLQHVHGGRYQIYRTNEIAGSGHKGGLELEVLDAQSNERRSVTTLSGGEKFLVALSLAIGLSTVVQAQGSGMKLEAMFVDEGFGTLDQHSILDALEVLQGIQKGNGLVGIISHVELLKEVIGSRIEVVKEENGSRCIIR